MYFGSLRGFLRGGPYNPEDETLDRPISNFDVLGIPTGQWSTPLFHVPQTSSEISSFCMAITCPCVLFAQIVTRAQIPLMIAVKNSCAIFRGRSGYPLYAYSFLLLIGLSAIFIALLVILSSKLSFSLSLFIAILCFVSFSLFIFINGHLRTAFKEKYELPSFLSPATGFWQLVIDAWISVACLPCSLAQMARHVFQYHNMDTELFCYFGDPSTLPPLRVDPNTMETPYVRPVRADMAGLRLFTNQLTEGVRDNRGNAHRQEEIMERQRNEILSNNTIRSTTPSAPPQEAQATIVRSQQPSSPIYNSDGSRV
eukprot:gene5380-7459_t